MKNNFYTSFIIWLVIWIIACLLCYYALNKFIIVYANTHSNSINTKLGTMQKDITTINDWVELVKKEWFTIECE